MRRLYWYDAGFGVFLVHPPMASVLLSASVEIFSVSRMQDFFSRCHSLVKEVKVSIRSSIKLKMFKSAGNKLYETELPWQRFHLDLDLPCVGCCADQ